MNSKGSPTDSLQIQEIHDGGGLYVHVAYCRSKCIYCDFFSAGERTADWHRYVDALCSEFRQRINELAWPLRTVYLGGGTPSLMPPEEFSRLCSFLLPYMVKVEEFTIEVNPDDVNESILLVWKNAGVNRLSIGIQTFDDACLRAIGRRHDAKTAINAYKAARKVFGNVSIDLMFGLPGQTIEAWRLDIRKSLELRPEHISAYCLMYEEGAPLRALRDAGRIQEASEEVTEKMFRILIDELSTAGYDHYEISNFALPGFRSRHNSSYWLQMPYIGLGPSAHSYDGISLRKSNRNDIKGYIAHFAGDGEDTSHGERPLTDIEWLSDEELQEEYVLTRMRMREGIPLNDFLARFGYEALCRLLIGCRSMVESGTLVLTDSNLSLSEEAILISDGIILELASHC